MRKIFFIALLLLVLSSATAYAELYYATANIELEIINNNPMINSIRLLPETSYPDSTITCDVDFYDEQDETARTFYTWRINGKVIKEDSYKLSEDFFVGDKIDCIAYVTDQFGASSSIKAATLTIRELPMRRQLINGAIDFIKELVT